MRGVARLGSPDLAPIDRVVSVLDLRMLGAVEAVDSAGHGVKLGGTRQRGLLALLALSAPNMVATDTIVEALWGEADVARPDAALHMAINRLRASIGDDLVVTESGGYRLEIPSPNSDVSRFRALVQRGVQLHTLGHPTKACESFRHALAIDERRRMFRVDCWVEPQVFVPS